MALSDVLGLKPTQYAMPFTLATTMGLVAVALENTPAFPTYPRRMTSEEVSAGLVLPFAAQTIMGTGGAAAVLLLMFMSCTSAISAQMIGVSTVLSHDVFRTYLSVFQHFTITQI